MLSKVTNHPVYKGVTNSDVGRFGKRIVNGRIGKAGFNMMLWDFGLGEEGLFSSATLASAKSWAGTAGMWPKTRIAGSIGFRALGPALTIYNTVQAYREGGLTNAATTLVKNSAWSFASGAAWEAAMSVGGGAVAYGIPLAMLGGAGYGTYKALQFGNARIRKARKLELGTPLIDPFGTASTMRQRSLQALQSSQFNGRSAFGSEAALLAMPYRRGM